LQCFPVKHSRYHSNDYLSIYGICWPKSYKPDFALNIYGVTWSIFAKIWYLLYMPIPYPFALKMKFHTPSQGKWFMYYNLPQQFEWMNTCTSFTFSTITPSTFFSNGTWSCLSRFVNFASTFCIKFIWVQYVSNVVLHRSSIFRIYFTQRLTFREHSKYNIVAPKQIWLTNLSNHTLCHRVSNVEAVGNENNLPRYIKLQYIRPSSFKDVSKTNELHKLKPLISLSDTLFLYIDDAQ
jgi:hypothetical protein